MARYARKINKQKMDDLQLKQIVQAEIFSATGSLLGSDGGGDLADRRRQAIEYYYSEPFGNEIDGRSEFILSEVHDAVESALPSLLAPFTSSDDIARFEPFGPEDEEAAKQATEYINYIFFNDNPGFTIIYDQMKDALIQKNGICKIFWEETDHTKRETMTGLSEEQVALVLYEADEDLETVEHTANDDGTHDLTVLRYDKRGKVRIMGVPPEEFLIARRAVAIEDADFVAHRVRKTISELIEEGYDPEKLEEIPSYDEAEYNDERLARFEADDEWPVDANELDPAMRSIWVYECYLRTDYNGDGVAELRKVTVAGPGYDLLDNEEIDEMPFVSYTPIPVPHKFFGLSLADETMDIQLAKSTILRQAFDNQAGINSNRWLVNDRIELDDIMTNRVNQVVRAEGNDPIQGCAIPMMPDSISQYCLPLLEYLDTVKESRTGITKYNQGMDADSLNKTATGIDRIMSASAKRQQMFARIYAETALKPMMQKCLRLVIKHQDKPRMIRLRNEWTPIDPRTWNSEMDLVIQVGLGYGTKEAHLFAMTQMMGIQERIAAAQGGLDGPVVTWKNVYNAGAKFLEAAEVKGVENFFQDPEDPNAQMPQPQPNPDMMKVQMEAQEKQGKQQLDAAKMQQDDRHFTEEMRLKWAEAQAKYGAEGQKMAIDREKMGLEGQKLVADVEGKRNDTALKQQDMQLREKEFLGGMASRHFEDLESARQELGEAQQGMQMLAEQLAGIAQQINELQQTMTAPIEVEPVRKNGKLVGAKRTQNGVTTEVMIQ